MLSSTSCISQLNPTDYDIDSETGFVAFDTSELPPYYGPWQKLIASLSDFLDSEQIRSQVNRLPTLSTASLTTNAHWRRAYVELGYLTQAYIWEDKDNPCDVLPVCLSAPFLDVCDHLGMKPALSYSGLCLWNCSPRPGESELTSTATSGTRQFSEDKNNLLSHFSQIKSYASFTGTRDEDAFNLIPVMIEAQSGKLIPLLLQALSSPPFQTLLSTLHTTLSTFQAITNLLSHLHQTCSPTTFHNQIRPFLRGSTSLPNGLSLHPTPTTTTLIKHPGGSAAQSPLFQFFDAILSISHEDNSTRLEMRNYMSRSHRQFLDEVDNLLSLPSVVATYPVNERDVLMGVLGECIDQLRRWRSRHIGVVTRYIVAPGGGGEKGTAGSLPIPFLKGFRDETRLKVGV